MDHPCCSRVGAQGIKHLCVGLAAHVSRAEVLDDQRHVVLRAKCPAPRAREHVESLPGYQRADVQELHGARLDPGQLVFGAFGREELDVDTVGDHAHLVGAQARPCEHLPDVLGRHPHFVCEVAQRLKPLRWDRAELPRLNDREPPGDRHRVHRRPAVPDLHVGHVGQWQVANARPVKSSAANGKPSVPVEVLAHGAVDPREAGGEELVSDPVDDDLAAARALAAMRWALA